MKEKYYEVCFITDDNFVLPTCVAIQSLIENNINIRINILCNKVSDKNLLKLREIKADRIEVRIIDVTKRYDYESFKKEGLHVSTAALIKFNLQDVFDDLDEILYLDGDILVKKDLRDFFDIDLGDKYGAVIADRLAYFWKGKNFNERLGTNHKGYFNTGVMLLNLKKMREDNIFEGLIEYKRKGLDDFMDQDAFNYVIGGNVNYLPLTCNAIATTVEFLPTRDLNLYYNSNFKSKEDIFDSACIWHYASPEKPWIYMSARYRKEWEFYFKRSIVSDEMINNKIYREESKKNKIRLLNLVGKNFENVKISIIIPCYNVEKYIRKCLESIILQNDFEELEVICVDDGSTDCTPDIINRLAYNDPRIVLIKQKNSFAGVARNNGIKVSHGEYITFIDSDDLLASGKNLLDCYNLAKKENCDMVMASAFNINQSYKKTSKCDYCLRKELLPKDKYIFSPLELHENLYYAFGGVPWSKLYKRELIVNNNINFLDFPKREDFYFVRLCLSLSKKIAYIDKDIVLHLEHRPGSLETIGLNDSPLIPFHANYLFRNKLEELGIWDDFKDASNLSLATGLSDNIHGAGNLEAIRKIFNISKKVLLDSDFENTLNRNPFFNGYYQGLKRLWDCKDLSEFIFNRFKKTVLLNQKNNVIIKDLKNKLLKFDDNSTNSKKDSERNVMNVSLDRLNKKINQLEHKVNNISGAEKKILYQIQKYAPNDKRVEMISDWYKEQTGQSLDLNNPITFNEKIQWLKIYDSTDLKATLSDKYLVRDYVSKIVGEKYLIPLLGVYDKFDDIDFGLLPKQFVIKCNHGSGYNKIVTDKSKINLKVLKKQFDTWMVTNFAYVAGFELHYSSILPRIVIEEYISGIDDLIDYKFFCFNGECKFIWTDTNRFVDHRRDLFDLNWNHLDYRIKFKNADVIPKKPDNLDEMLNVATKLAVGFKHVRVDLYNKDGKIYFGELTFTSGSGIEEFYPSEFGVKVGNLIKINS